MSLFSANKICSVRQLIKNNSIDMSACVRTQTDINLNADFGVQLN